MTAQDSGLADMRDMPMSAMWYWHLQYLRGVIRRLEEQHASAIATCVNRSHVSRERDGAARLHARLAIQQIDRYMRTMEAANVLSDKA